MQPERGTRKYPIYLSYGRCFSALNRERVPHLGFGAAFEQLFGGLVDMKTSDIRDKQLRINTAGGAAFAELHMS